MLTGFPLGLFLLLVSNHLLDRPDIGRTLLPETLEIENFNELRERSLPRFLLVVRLATEPLRIHAEFSRHLDVRVGKMEALARINPRLVLGREILLPFRHTLLLHWKQ